MFHEKKHHIRFLFNVMISIFVSGSTINTWLHDKINPKDCQVLSLGDSGFLQIFRVVSSDYGKPRVWFHATIKFLISQIVIGGRTTRFLRKSLTA